MRRYWPWLLGAAILTLLLATQWNWFAMPFERDEGEYAYAAWLLNNGGVPYRDAFMQKPPMIIYTYWLAQRLSDTACWPPRVLAFLFVALTLGVTAWAARREYGARCGWISAWLFVPMIALQDLSSVAANTEKFMNLPLMLAVALHLYGRDNPRRWVWLAAGASAACAVLYKPICVPVMAFVFAVWAVNTARQAGGWRRACLFAGFVMTGAAGVTVLSLLFFIRHGAWGSLWEAVVTFNQAYSAVSGWGPAAFLRQARGFLLWWWPLIMATGWFVGNRPKRGWYWAALLLIACLVAYKDANRHYYVMLVPFWVIIAARGLEGLGDWLQRHQMFDWHRWLTVACVLLLLIPVVPLMRFSPNALARRLYGDNPFMESSAVARELAAITDPRDLVYMAGSEPQILFYARRRSVTRFVISYPLMLPTKYARAYQNEVMQTLRTYPPKAVVFSTHPCSWLMHPDTAPHFMPVLQQFISGRYQPVGHYVWRTEAEGCWLMPYHPAYQGGESLIIFERKE
jgi:hypothetical protein